jgi:hypothetical protein
VRTGSIELKKEMERKANERKALGQKEKEALLKLNELGKETLKRLEEVTKRISGK